jgi:sulfatase maturation enzyme AslB (radical SAM superfamily)
MYKGKFSSELKFGQTFCPLPFISYHLDVRKHRKLCCISKHVVSDERLQEIQTSILNNQPVIECQKCYDKEKLNLISRRQLQLKDWLKHPDILNDTTVSPKVYDYDLRYSNLCNLECQMCNPVDSSAIAQRQGKVVPFFQYESDLEITPDAKRIYFAGGEPFMIKSFSRLLETVENKDCEIVINTNGTILTDHMLTALDKFTNVNFTVSIDGYGKLNEQIRKNSIWNDIERNIDLLAKRYGGYAHIHIGTVVQRDNVNQLLELGNWISNKNINQWTMMLLNDPEQYHFSQCDNIVIPDELFALPVVARDIETVNLLKHIKNYAQN